MCQVAALFIGGNGKKNPDMLLATMSWEKFWIASSAIDAILPWAPV